MKREPQDSSPNEVLKVIFTFYIYTLRSFYAIGLIVMIMC